MGVSKQQAGNSHHLLPVNISTHYVGRFAPSPTGPLHFGSLIAATASYLCARQHPGGKWLLRIEDIDTQRCHNEHTKSIIETIEHYGFQWDGKITYQSKRTDLYQYALDSIRTHTYPCSCTRKQLSAFLRTGKYGYIYPGSCRKEPLNPGSANFSMRLKTNSERICFEDQCQGKFCQNIEDEIGDYILKRADSTFAYQLAVVVDDSEQGVTQIVRGADLFDNTPRQIYLQRLLSYKTPQYLHFPVAVTSDGKKLSKQNLSKELPITNKRQQIMNVLRFLGQDTPDCNDFESLDDLWRWAVQNWDSTLIPRKLKIHYEPANKK